MTSCTTDGAIAREFVWGLRERSASASRPPSLYRASHLYPFCRLMPKRSHCSENVSSRSSSAVMNFTRAFHGAGSCQGIPLLRSRLGMCHLCHRSNSSPLYPVRTLEVVACARANSLDRIRCDPRALATLRRFFSSRKRWISFSRTFVRAAARARSRRSIVAQCANHSAENVRGMRGLSTKEGGVVAHQIPQSLVMKACEVSEDWQRVHAELRQIARKRRALDVRELRLIREAIRIAIWRHVGMTGIREYLEDVFGYGPKVASERVRVAEALASLPALEDALDCGQLSYSAVREISRIATSRTEDEWVGACRGKNQRQVEELLAEREVGDRPGSPRKPELR